MSSPSEASRKKATFFWSEINCSGGRIQRMEEASLFSLSEPGLRRLR